MVKDFGFEVISEQLYLGDATAMPTEEINPALDGTAPFPNGKYNAKVYAINSNQEELEEQGIEINAENLLADIVIILKPRKTDVIKIIEEPLLEWDPSIFLFRETPKLKLGTIIKRTA